jgi:hypothetical protein
MNLQVFDVDANIEHAPQLARKRRSTVRFAFPITQGAADDTARQLFAVYATLPVDDVGLPFLLNGDWEATTNRDHVQTSDLGNIMLRDALARELVSLYNDDPFFKEEGGRRIPDSLPLQEDVMKRRGGSYLWWLRFVREVHTQVKEAELLQGSEGDRWIVTDARLQKLVEADLWSEIGIERLQTGAHRSSRELLRLLNVKEVGWVQLACLIDKAQEYERQTPGTVENRLGLWLYELREKNFEPLYECLASGLTAKLTDLAAYRHRKTDHLDAGRPRTELQAFRERWAALRIFRGM